MTDLVTDDDLLTIAQAVARQKLAKKGSAITDKQRSNARGRLCLKRGLYEFI